MSHSIALDSRSSISSFHPPSFHEEKDIVVTIDADADTAPDGNEQVQVDKFIPNDTKPDIIIDIENEIKDDDEKINQTYSTTPAPAAADISHLLPPTMTTITRSSSAPTSSATATATTSLPPTSPPLSRAITDPADLPSPTSSTSSRRWAWGRMAHTTMLHDFKAKLTKQISSEPEFFCVICQCNCVISDRIYIFEPPSQGTCDHAFCHDCLVAYITFEINEGRVLSLTCPGQEQDGETHCQSSIPASKIKQLVDAETFEKYERFIKQKSDDNYRACPTCGHLQKGTSRSPAMICERPGCGTKYCFHHSNAHPDQTCSQYKRTNRDAFKANRKFVNSETVHCPWCSVPILKVSGCNHMTCSQCGSEFCYLCGGWYLGGVHFSDWNIFGCPGMKSDSGGANSRGQWWRKLLRLFGYPLTLVCIIAIASIAIVLFVAFEALWIALFFGLSPIWMILLCCFSCGPFQSYSARETLQLMICFGPLLPMTICCGYDDD